MANSSDVDMETCFIIAVYPWRQTMCCENTRRLRSVQQECCRSPGWIPSSESPVPHLSNPPGLISCGGERHPLTSSSIIRDGREPLWVLSNSIQEFSQPVQSSLDKLTPFHPPSQAASLLCCPTIPWCNPDSRLSTSTEAQRKVGREKRSKGKISGALARVC